MTTTITHWIDGKPASGLGSRTGDVYDPATGEVTASVTFAGEEDVDAAVAAARAAFPAWRDASLAKRTAVLFAFREILHARRDELAAVITAQHGKVLADAAGEVQRGLEVVEGRLVVASQADSALHWVGVDRGVPFQKVPGRPADIALDTRRGHIAVPYIALDRVDVFPGPPGG